MDWTQARQGARFVRRLYAEQARLAFDARVRRDPVARLMSAEGRADPYPIYERLRAGGPVVGVRDDHLATTSHAVCNEILRGRNFGVRSEDGVVHAGIHGDAEEFDLSFLGMNPPDHTRLRRLAQPAFSPRMMRAYTERIDKTVTQLVDHLELADEFDLVGDFAAPLPIVVISEMLGVPDADQDAFQRYGAALGSALDGVKSIRHARQLIEADVRLREMFQRLFDARRAEPREDVISAVVAAEAAGSVSEEELEPLVGLLLVAGFETTVNLIGNAVLALMAHREQWSALVDDPSLAAAVIEETLRWDPPVQRTVRVAFSDTTLAGVPVPAGQWVVAMLAAAGRDPEVYAAPEVFDIHRDQTVEHLAFSSGIHYCVGAPLARLEATRALAALADRMPSLRVTGPVTRRASNIIRGAASIPMSPR